VEEFWRNAKDLLLVDSNKFRQKVNSFNHRLITKDARRRLEHYAQHKGFQPEAVALAAPACYTLCMWLHAMLRLDSTVITTVDPLTRQLDYAKQWLMEKKALLAEHIKSTVAVGQSLNMLEYRKELLQQSVDSAKTQLENSECTLTHLNEMHANVKLHENKWNNKVDFLYEILNNAMGDSMLTAGLVAYGGLLGWSPRGELMRRWKAEMCRQQMAHTPYFRLTRFCLPRAAAPFHAATGLPPGEHALENAMLVMQSWRWPLLFDPQGLGRKWLLNLVARKCPAPTGSPEVCVTLPELVNMDMEEASVGWKRAGIAYDREVLLKDCVEQGKLLLIQLSTDRLDRSLLAPLLKLRRMDKDKEGAEVSEMVDCKEGAVKMHKDFRLVLLLPQVSMEEACAAMAHLGNAVNPIDFVLTPESLVAQLLTRVQAVKAPEAEIAYQAALVTMQLVKNLGRAAEAEVLKQCAGVRKGLLDDENFIGQLFVCRDQIIALKQQAEEQRIEEVRREAERLTLRQLVASSALIWFSLCDMVRVHPIYHYSLQAFLSLFQRCLENDEEAALEDDAVASILSNKTGAAAMKFAFGATVVAVKKPKVAPITEIEEAGVVVGHVVEGDFQAVKETEEGETSGVGTGPSELTDNTVSVYTLEERMFGCFFERLGRCLLARHRVIFGVTIVVRSLQAKGQVTQAEWQTFLRSPAVARTISVESLAPAWRPRVWDSDAKSTGSLSAYDGLSINPEEEHRAARLSTLVEEEEEEEHRAAGGSERVEITPTTSINSSGTMVILNTAFASGSKGWAFLKSVVRRNAIVKMFDATCPGWISVGAWAELESVGRVVDGMRALLGGKAHDGGLMGGLEDESAWREWINHLDPFSCPLPGGWDAAAPPLTLRRLLLLRCLHPPGVVLGMKRFIACHLGEQYTSKAEPFDMVKAEAAAMPWTPLLCLHEPGTSPVHHISLLAERMDVGMLQVLSSGPKLSTPKCLKAVRAAASKGQWVLLENCHLAVPGTMPAIMNLVAALRNEGVLNCTSGSTFKLWLATALVPHTHPMPAELLNDTLRSVLVAFGVKGCRDVAFRDKGCRVVGL
jgi:hypothetical protein